MLASNFMTLNVIRASLIHVVCITYMWMHNRHLEMEKEQETEIERDDTNLWGWHEWGMFHLDHRCELICEHEVGSLSRAMGQVLLPRVGGVPINNQWWGHHRPIEGNMGFGSIMLCISRVGARRAWCLCNMSWVQFLRMSLSGCAIP